MLGDISGCYEADPAKELGASRWPVTEESGRLLCNESCGSVSAKRMAAATSTLLLRARPSGF